jgi:tRNA pseudouridine38-40 synthase
LRYFIHFSYKGTNYSGWQIQENAISVQAILEDALSKILNITIKLTGSSRTDSGVHARHQVAHFDINFEINEADLVFRLNNFLPNDIAVISVKQVKPTVHSRFDALSRTYEYVITRKKDPFRAGGSYYWYGPVDIELLVKLSAELMQYEDFKSFCKGNDPKHHYKCKIMRSEWFVGEDVLIYTIQANRFLRGMVRTIAGTLLDFASGKITDRTLSEIVYARDIKKAGRLLPAEGLFLIQVEYPEGIYID